MRDASLDEKCGWWEEQNIRRRMVSDHTTLSALKTIGSEERARVDRPVDGAD
jgi:hypothetical protein